MENLEISPSRRTRRPFIMPIRFRIVHVKVNHVVRVFLLVVFLTFMVVEIANVLGYWDDEVEKTTTEINEINEINETTNFDFDNTSYLSLSTSTIVDLELLTNTTI